MRHMLVLCASAGALFWVAGCRVLKGPSTPGAATSGEVSRLGGRPTRTKLALPNGVTVVLEENHASPVVALQAWVAAGSADDAPAQPGAAHLLEHMLARTAPAAGGVSLTRAADAAGAQARSWTSLDATVYQTVFAAAAFDQAIDLLARALTVPRLEPAELERERQAVLREIRQTRDMPERAALQVLFSTAFTEHPYRAPLVGTEAAISALSRAELLGAYQERYRAENLTVVAVGDFDAKHAREKIAAAFGVLPKGARPAARRAEPAQSAPRAQVEAREVEEPHLLVAFHTPPVTHDDTAALDLLSVVLGQGEASRLAVQIVRNRQAATSAHSYTFAARDAGLLIVGAALPARAIEEPARAIVDEVLRLAREEISPAELARARTLLESRIAIDKQTVDGYARRLGFFASVAGDADAEDRYAERLSRLTPGDLRQIAARIFRPANTTIAAVVPTAFASRRDGAPEKIAARLQGIVAAADARLDARFAHGEGVAPGELFRAVLPTGTRLLVLPDPTVPVVAVRALWSGGLRLEDARSNGATSLLADLITRGTRTRPGDQLAAELDALSASLAGDAGQDSLGLSAEFPAAHADRALELVIDCLANPLISDEDVETQRRVALERLRAQAEDLGLAARHLFQSTFYPRHPYRRDLLGTLESVSTLSRRRLVDHYRRYYPMSALTLVVVGDVDAARVEAKLRALVAELPAAPADHSAVARDPLRDEPVQVFESRPRDQAHVVIGYPGLSYRDKDRFALALLAHVLSGPGGRLATALRNGQARAAVLAASSAEGVDPGTFSVYLASSPAEIERAVQVVRDELARVAAAGITPQELERSRPVLVGAQALALEGRGALASALAWSEVLGEGARAYRDGPDAIGRVTAADVQRVARKVLDRRHEVLAAVKPPEETPAAQLAVRTPPPVAPPPPPASSTSARSARTTAPAARASAAPRRPPAAQATKKGGRASAR